MTEHPRANSVAKYHLRPDSGEPGLCRAREGNCPFGDSTEHYSSPEAARKAYEEKARGGASFESLRKTKLFKLLAADGKVYLSSIPGTLGGHRRQKTYGRLDCASAIRYIEKGQYVQHRVFFADEATAVAAGYRPCARCLPAEYKLWKESR